MELEPFLEAPTLAAILTGGGASIVTSVLVQYAILPLLQLTEQARDRFGPFIAILTGIVVVEVATFTVIVGPTRQDVVQGAVTGIFAGLAAIGLHSVGKRVAPQ